MVGSRSLSATLARLRDAVDNPSDHGGDDDGPDGRIHGSVIPKIDYSSSRAVRSVEH